MMMRDSIWDVIENYANTLGPIDFDFDEIVVLFDQLLKLHPKNERLGHNAFRQLNDLRKGNEEIIEQVRKRILAEYSSAIRIVLQHGDILISAYELSRGRDKRSFPPQNWKVFKNQAEVSRTIGNDRAKICRALSNKERWIMKSPTDSTVAVDPDYLEMQNGDS